MREKHLSFAQVHDIFGFRIVVGTLPECYLALGALHPLYKPMPGRFKDYIAIPKANGYQSLHTTLVGPLGTAVEFQIRTEQMHAVAETGVAAHWLYKSKDDGPAARRRSAWARCGCSRCSRSRTRRATRSSSSSTSRSTFPRRGLRVHAEVEDPALPRGATPVDFAYAIHTDIGNHCVAAKVNGELVPLRTELRNGDVVEIITRAGRTAEPGVAQLRAHRPGALARSATT